MRFQAAACLGIVTTAAIECGPPPAYKYHAVVTTSSDNSNCYYQDWQNAILYERILEMQTDPCGSAIANFTRLLVGPPDRWMDRIPTMLVEGEDRSATATPGYIQGGRPRALVQFGEKVLPYIQEDYILMLEPDMFMLSDFPAEATPTRPLLVHYDYMSFVPHNQLILDAYRRHMKDDQFMPSLFSGPSPGLFHRDQFLPIMTEFRQLVHDLWIDDQEQARRHENDSSQLPELWGWIKDMHAFVLAMYKLQLDPIVKQRIFLCTFLSVAKRSLLFCAL